MFADGFRCFEPFVSYLYCRFAPSLPFHLPTQVPKVILLPTTPFVHQLLQRSTPHPALIKTKHVLDVGAAKLASTMANNGSTASLCTVIPLSTVPFRNLMISVTMVTFFLKLRNCACCEHDIWSRFGGQMYQASDCLAVWEFCVLLLAG